MRHAFVLLVLSALSITVLESCGHTNNLKDYKLREQRMTFRSRWNGTMSAEANIYSPVRNPAADVAATIGSIAASSAATDMLKKAVQPEVLAVSVSSGIEDVLRTYLKVVPVRDSVSESIAIVESEVTEFSLHSHQSGIYATVRANTRMLNRSSGKVMWEDCEHVSVPLRSGVDGRFDPTGLSGIVNAAQLSNLSDEEISKAMIYAAEDAGRKLGETLREDIAELP